MGRRKRDAVSPNVPPSHPVQQPTVGRELTKMALLLEEPEVCATRQALQPLGSALERQAPQTSGF